MGVDVAFLAPASVPERYNEPTLGARGPATAKALTGETVQNLRAFARAFGDLGSEAPVQAHGMRRSGALIGLGSAVASSAPSRALRSLARL